MRAALGLCTALALTAPASARAPASAIPPHLNAYLLAHYSDAPTDRFAVAWADLNGDGNREAIVHVLSPGWCGTGGA